ncbi:fibronectin type III domain-containing protein [Gelidibacter maritimus]|uniref:Fibronectin type III domain-containing protein n=1 Tax=Gelidibacter maritimus TaxID=2761487 RepID=A0A7W2M3J3_9FLAO|nr:fibronectin type III domain-containing protein [Gelidibacter maritimus]MBA6152056.1 fibronectin type III domain-containing protein [Gelidibacter maritimus]
MQKLNKDSVLKCTVVWKTLLATAVIFACSFTTTNAQIAGEVCENPLVISSLPFMHTGNTGDYGDNYDSSDKPRRADGAIGDPSSSFLRGDDVVYAYTPSEDGTIDISVINNRENTGFFIFTGCPFESSVGGDASRNEENLHVYQLPVSSGVTYYIVISTDRYPQMTPYTLNITSCKRPTDLVVENVMHTSAELSWASDVDQGDIYVMRSYRLAPNISSLPTETSVSSPFTIDNLIPGVEYHAYARADCGDQDGVSEWSEPISFSTTCDAVSSLPYIENFDAYRSGTYWFPECWERPVIFNSTAINIYPSISGHYQTSSYPNTLRFYSQTGTPTYAVSPSFAEDISNLRVKFTLKREELRSGTIDVGVMSDANDVSTFELVATIDPDNNDFNAYYFDLNQVSLSGSGNYIALRHNSNSANYDYHLDDFKVELTPSCLEPTNAVISNITTTSGIFSWETITNHSDFYIAEAGGTSPDENTTPTLSNVSSPITLNQLTPNTEYDAYVRVDCGAEGGLSAWTGPVRFFTRCTATNTPFLQNFEFVTVPNISNCESLETNNGKGWETRSLNTFGFNGNVLSHKYTRIGDGPVDAWYFTQGINLKAGVDYSISYVYGNNSEQDIDKLKVAYGTSANSSAMIVELADHEFQVTTPQSSEVIFSVDNDGVYYFGFQAHSDKLMSWIYVDDIFVDVLRTCPVSAEVVVDNIETNQAQLSWTSTGQNQWEVLYVESGFNHLEDGTSVTVQGLPNTTLVNLTSETTYDVYLRNVCAVDDKSYWVGPQTFKTETSCPRPTNIQIDNVGHDSVQISWEAGSSESEWIVYYGGVIGYDPVNERLISFDPKKGEGESVTVQGSPQVTLTGLKSAEEYQVYVEAVCAEEDRSSIPPYVMARFITELEGGYCMVYPERVRPITNVEFATIKNLQLGRGSGPGFQDFTDMVAEVNAGDTYTINIEGNTIELRSSFTVFIDWNQDGEFNNDDERYEVGTIFNSNGFDDKVISMDIQVPTEAVNGMTRMRVISRGEDRNSEYVPNACELPRSLGQVEAYTVNVKSDVDPVDCQIPTALTLGAVTFDGDGAQLVVSWMAGGIETQWELSYVNANDAADSGSAMVNTTPQTILDLTAGQGYSIKVRSICDGANSAWTEVAEMTLGFDDIMFTNFTYYPNPVTNQLTLQSAVLIDQVEVYNLLGQKVIQMKPGAVEVQLETKQLQSAIYLMKVSIGGSHKVFRIVKK